VAKKKERKNRLKSLILLLFLTIVLLSTSTYAWFTANRSVSIDPINVQIAASSGLQISTNASEWKTLITNTDITTGYTGHKNMLPSELSPVSTSGAVSGGLMTFFDGLVEGDRDNGGAMSLTATATDAEAAGTSSHFIAFDIFLKVDDSDGADIYLSNGSGVTVTSGKDDKGLQYAARYGFVIEGNVASTAGASAATVLNGGTSSIIVEPNYDAHTSTGVANATGYYNYTTTEVQQAASGAPAVNYVGVKAAISTPIILANTNVKGTYDNTKFGQISTLYLTNVAYSNGGTTKEAYKGSTKETNLLNVFHLETGITKIRVYMWIEGQDVDCENAASGAFLTYNLGFKLDNE
jgi:hypothetical protein